nr:PREDICTED: uncharacterized protein LOC106705262 [Latimeria chalumnae]|eukprot:XP_014349691.1 PREDICTED: uncharacterized protein LOC106705262 [Latimeria chalumnae]
MPRKRKWERPPQNGRLMTLNRRVVNKQQISLEKYKTSKESLELMISKNSMDILTKADMKEIHKSITDLTGHMKHTEVQISTTVDSMAAMQRQLDKQQKESDKMWQRLTDLEGRSRRSNLRIFGLTEGTETNPADMCLIIKQMLQEILLPPEAALSFNLERAHRTLQPPPRADQRPRAVVVKCKSYQAKEYILQIARRERRIMW